MAGQINLSTEFGRRLRDLAALPDLRVWVDVGTWSGQGSTLCIAEGMKSRKDLSGCAIISLEASKEWYAVASDFWRKSPLVGAPLNLPVHILHGRIAESMMTETEARQDPAFESIKDHFNLHYHNDWKDFHDAPLIKISAADAVVLDGGEWAGYQDWLQIKPLRPKIVALDDIYTCKNLRVFQEMLMEGWRVTYICDDRNGSAILRAP